MNPGRSLLHRVVSTAAPDSRCCPSCWNYGKAVPVRTPCPFCVDRAEVHTANQRAKVAFQAERKAGK
jgi:hypothetical protein